MQGIIVNFRKSKRVQKTNHIIIKVGEKKEDAVKLIGKSVSWKSPAGKEITGKIAKEHGRNGCIRAIFEKGLPGQSVGQKVSIS